MAAVSEVKATFSRDGMKTHQATFPTVRLAFEDFCDYVADEDPEGSANLRLEIKLGEGLPEIKVSMSSEDFPLLYDYENAEPKPNFQDAVNDALTVLELM